MYVEYRETGSTPRMWAESFDSRSRFQDTVTVARLRTDVRWRRIRRRLQGGDRVLDAGCGLGQWVVFLRLQGLTSMGLDYSEALIERLEQLYPGLGWLDGSILEIPAESGSFQAVISWGVIEHDEAGPDAALDEFRRVLAPGGRVFVTVPMDTPRMRRASGAAFGEPGKDARFFQYFFTPQEIADALQRVGFTVEEVVPVTPHIATVLPRTYAVLARMPGLARDIGTQLLKPCAWAHPGSRSMLLAVARK